MATLFNKPISDPKIHEASERFKIARDGGWRIDWSKTPGVLAVRYAHADNEKTCYYQFTNREWKEISASKVAAVFEDVNGLSFDAKQKRMARYIVTKHVDALIEMVCQTKHLKREDLLPLSAKQDSVYSHHKKT